MDKKSSDIKSLIQSIKKNADPFWVENGLGTRFQKFQNLMRYRIRDVLIVSSLYDLYIFEEDGRLYELIRSEYRGLNLSHTPELTHVSSGKDAIRTIREEKRFDLVITTLHIEDMPPSQFAKKLRQEGISIPIIMLAFDNRELAEILARREDKLFDQIFIWLGNYRLLLAIIKYLEDRHNVEHDTHIMGVQSILFIEDNIRDYSSLLPTIFIEIINQSQRAIREGISLAHKNLRQRARPKILLCRTYEEAWRYYERYHDTVMGVISDIDFPRNGKNDERAGLILAQNVRKRHPDIPILLQSSMRSLDRDAREIGCEFVYKESPTLHQELRHFMITNLGFGDFVFKTKDGQEVGRANDLISLEKQLKVIPPESLIYHAERNHFSNWLKARTEFWLAHKLRPRRVSDFASVEDLRQHLISSLRSYRKSWQQGQISDFSRERFDPNSSISRVGEGALGGKARGLSFFNMLISSYNIQKYFKGVRLSTPPALVLTTDIFDYFMEKNNLRAFALQEEDDLKILQRFTRASEFSEKGKESLRDFLEMIHGPLAVRSSSLLEGSHNHPFAGIYETVMLPNCHPQIEVRLQQLLLAIKTVYASTYFHGAKQYFHNTSFRLEEEKMAVIVQKMVGKKHGNRFYPTFSGVARSHNFYPVPPQKSTDGVACVALGLGKMVVEGGLSLRFCPKYPRKIMQLASPDMAVKSSQREFFALDLEECNFPQNGNPLEALESFLKTYSLREAEEDGELAFVGSTYSPENQVIYDDISSKGFRLVTFAPILKYDLLPLAEILQLLLELGKWGMGTAVEIEFAVNMNTPGDEDKEFSLLQIRPVIIYRELENFELNDQDGDSYLCRTNQVMGHGIISGIRDIVVVDRDNFDRSKSRSVAREVSEMNRTLVQENRPYILIGVGRWGTRDPWLGIPVKWDQISGARAIVETSFKELIVNPSQGSHFFENLTTFMVGYFTITTHNKENFVDWDWLSQQPVFKKLEFTRLLRFEDELVVKMNGRKNEGVILKPGADSRGGKAPKNSSST